MAHKQALVAAVLALSSLVLSRPTELFEMGHMAIEEMANITWTVDRHMLAAFECLGQSCVAADTAGSTGREPILKAEGASDADIQCIIKHNPSVGELLKSYGGKPPDVPKQDTGIVSSLMGGLNGLWRPLVTLSGSTLSGKFTGSCTKNILIFAKGTLEPGVVGMLVGPSLTTGLPSGWSYAGVPYDPDVPGDYCLGLPGGMVAKDVINQAAQKCPDSNLFLSGYSQGAMVVRNGLARAEDDAKRRVKVSTRISYLPQV
jgi:hypothetical protein